MARLARSPVTISPTSMLFPVAILIGLGIALATAWYPLAFDRWSRGLSVFVLLSFLACLALLVWSRQRRERQGYRVAAEERVQRDSLSFFFWFTGHHLFWATVACAGGFLSVALFGPTVWVAILISGLAACGVFALASVLFARPTATLGLCWQQNLPDRFPGFWARADTVMILSHRYRMAVRTDDRGRGLSAIARVLDLARVGGAERGPDLWSRGFADWQRELTARGRISAVLFSVAMLVAFLVFVLLPRLQILPDYRALAEVPRDMVPLQSSDLALFEQEESSAENRTESDPEGATESGTSEEQSAENGAGSDAGAEGAGSRERDGEQGREPGSRGDDGERGSDGARRDETSSDSEGASAEKRSGDEGDGQNQQGQGNREQSDRSEGGDGQEPGDQSGGEQGSGEQGTEGEGKEGEGSGDGSEPGDSGEPSRQARGEEGTEGGGDTPPSDSSEGYGLAEDPGQGGPDEGGPGAVPPGGSEQIVTLELPSLQYSGQRQDPERREPEQLEGGAGRVSTGDIANRAGRAEEPAETDGAVQQLPNWIRALLPAKKNRSRQP